MPFFSIFAPMKRILIYLSIVAIACLPTNVSAQAYIKLNVPYAFVGILNAQAEFVVSNHSSVAFDATYSPWRSFNGKHLNFGIALFEYRYYFNKVTCGLYLSTNTGISAFDIHKPQFFIDGKFFSRQDDYGKGFGIMTGIGVGWERHIGKRWLMDIFISVDRIWSWYNRYHNDGTIVMYPQGHEYYLKPDPFNGSAEYMPIKGGVSFGYRIFRPKY